MDVMTLAFWSTTMAMAVRLSAPYLFAGLGGLIAQHSGVYNFALEGMMLGGAYFGYLGAVTSGSIWMGMLWGVLFGLLAGIILAYIVIRFGVSQMVISLGMNTLFMGVTGFAFRLNSANAPVVEKLLPNVDLGFLSEIPIIGPMLFKQNLLVYIIIVLFLLYAWLFRRTTLGLCLRSVGENPAAAQTAGINVFRYRYIAVAASGVLASLGGAFLTLTQVNRFAENMTGGRGWIAIAAISLGRYDPIGTFFSCLLFGFATALSNQLQALNIGIPYRVAMMVPYVLAIIALLGSRSKKSGHGPAALGKPYLSRR